MGEGGIVMKTFVLSDIINLRMGEKIVMKTFVLPGLIWKWGGNSNEDLCPSWPNMRRGGIDLCPFWRNLGIGKRTVIKTFVLPGLI